MAQPQYQRLSALDAAFLSMETDAAHMHVGAVAILDARELLNEHGGIQFEVLRRRIAGAVADVPRLHQRVQRVPGFGHPVWVSDPHFHLDYHVRHTSLPRPGTAAQLLMLAGQVFSRRLDRAHSPWELWVVEGLEAERFALIIKIHHCLIDGIGALTLLNALVESAREASSLPVPGGEHPAPPSKGELWWAELRHRYEGLQHALRGARKAWLTRAEGPGEAADISRGIREAFRSNVRPVSPTSLNPEHIGPHRRFETLVLELAQVNAVRGALGGTLSDLVLAIVTGALRLHFLRREEDPAAIESFRALMPVSLPRPDAEGGLGDRIALLMASLPLAEEDPIKRLARIRQEVERRTHESHELAAGDFVERLDDELGLGLVAAGLKLAVSLRAFNVVVASIPGPPVQVPLLGAPLCELYPLVPLFTQQALGVALFSYDGRLYWGLSADDAAIEDLEELSDDIHRAFEELRRVAGLA